MQEIQEKVASLDPGEVAVIGDFPTAELARELEREVRSWIKKAVREGILPHNYIVARKRPSGSHAWVVTVYCYDSLSISVHRVQSQSQEDSQS